MDQSRGRPWGTKTGWSIEFIGEVKPLQEQVHATQIMIVAG